MKCRIHSFSYLFVYLFVDLLVYLSTWIYKYKCTYMHACMHTYIHTYIHTYKTPTKRKENTPYLSWKPHIHRPQPPGLCRMEETSISQTLTQFATMEFSRCSSVAFGMFYGLHLWQRGGIFEPVKSTSCFTILATQTPPLLWSLNLKM